MIFRSRIYQLSRFLLVTWEYPQQPRELVRKLGFHAERFVSMTHFIAKG